MTDDSHVDGNALGGILLEALGRDMTADLGCCGNCGAINPFGAAIVYRDAPGDVMRCRDCLEVLMVIVSRAASSRISVGYLSWIEATSGTTS